MRHVIHMLAPMPRDGRRLTDAVRVVMCAGLLMALMLGMSPIAYAAGTWKPLCVDGSACRHEGRVFDASGPVHTLEGMWFQHRLVGSTSYSVGFFDVTADAGSRVLANEGAGYASDDNTLTLRDGTVLFFGVTSLQIRDADGAILVDHINWSGWDLAHSLSYYLVGPPVALGDSVYVGLTTGGGGVHLFRSTDGGYTWSSHAAPTTSPVSYRFNLVANPDGSGLWLHQREFFDIEPSLWESLDEGATWNRIDDGSFPAQTLRIVHDPDHPDTSYALTARGLKVGRPDPQGRIHWQATSMWRTVHGLAFVDRIPPLSRALVIGTDTGVLVSVDEAKTWEPMAAGLLAIPHTVTWAHGMLVATSEAGYFTCNTVDCAGVAQPVPPAEERGPVTVTEFYHRDLDHYFMTASAEEAAGIDAGAAGPGWVRTGQAFTAWSVLGNPEAGMNLCRFYGSVEPGPNSHFFTLSTGECSQLMDLQARTPVTEPRWNFEGYAFAAMPPADDVVAPCPEAAVPVYRAYNRGFERGEDSNHRYVTDRALLGPLVARGWVEEGVAFCVLAA